MLSSTGANTSAGFLVRWERTLPVPDVYDNCQARSFASAAGPGCLWHGGTLANRSDLLARLDLPVQTTDAALLQALYAAQGNDAAAQIAGALAWLVWDAPRRRLVAVRDRIGTLCLYYTVQGATIWVASDLEALLATMPGPHRYNLPALVAHIDGGGVAAGQTYYADVHSVPPGAILTIEPDRISCDPYWQLGPRPLLNLRTDAEYAEAYRDVLYTVTAGYVVDSAMGITLSSGMDSTTIAAGIKAVAPAANLTAVTYTTPELPSAEENHLARLVAERLEIEQDTVRADLCWPLSTPEGIKTDRTSPFLLYFEEMWDAVFTQFRRRGVQVVFDGMGGDPMFGGNVFVYPDLLLTGRWRQLAQEFSYHLPRSPVKSTLWSAVRAMMLRPMAEAYFPAVTSRRVRTIPWLNATQVPLWRATLAPPEPPRLMLPGRAQRMSVMRNRFTTYVAEHTCRRARTRHAVELRHPLLDHRLYEFAARLPTTQTMRAGQRKIVVRNAMRGILPDAIVDMWGKITPEAIAVRGLREREQAKVWPLMTDMRAAAIGLVDEARLRQAYQAYVDGTSDDASFWYSITLEDWLRRYF